MTESKTHRFQNVKIGGIKNNDFDLDDIEPEIEYSNMSKDIQEYVIKLSKDAMKANSENSINNYIKISKLIKTNLDNEKKGIWNVIVGSDYGSYLSYDKSFLLFYRIKEVYFLIFRYGIDESIIKATKDN